MKSRRRTSHQKSRARKARKSNRGGGSKESEKHIMDPNRYIFEKERKIQESKNNQGVFSRLHYQILKKMKKPRTKWQERHHTERKKLRRDIKTRKKTFDYLAMQDLGLENFRQGNPTRAYDDSDSDDEDPFYNHRSLSRTS
jgi:hypothetical protein